jgi:dienelactone hydrolase
VNTSRLAFLTSILLTGSAGLAEIPASDLRNVEIRHTDMVYSLPDYTADEWKQRAAFLRKQVLFSAGLLPMPAKTPLGPRAGTEIEHEDYSVASVLLETYPGYYLGGNLYRPVGKSGPFPAVVSPHGHWRYGRFENSELNSVPARAISLARQGYVVFAYDMVGWNDTMQTPHGFAGPREELWLFGSLGLQLWNSIRVVDYLASLPDVDVNRIGVTGASGGATQAFLLAAVDDRIRYSAPVNMVSFQMQGGSRCENAPLLRIDTNNVEISAAFAPKPQLLVSATGDWTVNVPKREFPAVQRIYRLMDAESNVEWRQFDSPHNYHQDSRESVYEFFGKHILGDADSSHFSERASRLDQLSEVLYLWGRRLPEGAVSHAELVRQRIAAAEADTLTLAISDAESLQNARAAFSERLALALLADVPAAGATEAQTVSGGDLVLGREGIGDRIPARLLNADSRSGRPVLFVHADGMHAAAQSAVGKALARMGAPVPLIDAFQTGPAVMERDIAAAGRNAQRYYHVFNRSDDANRVQDILTAAAYLRGHTGSDTINLVAFGRAGLWALLAASLDRGMGAVVADLDGFDATNDAAYVEGLYIPGLRRAGDFRAVAALASTNARVMLHNVHGAFPVAWFNAAFKASGRADSLSVPADAPADSDILEWLAQ